MNKTIASGVRTDTARFKKWESLANRLGVSRNQVFNLLIDNVAVVSEPEVKVSLNGNSRSAQILAEAGATAVDR